jgi:hypothetical protein
MPSIGQTWVLASNGAVVEMGTLSTLKRLLMESNPKGAEHSASVIKKQMKTAKSHVGYFQLHLTTLR